MKSKDLKQCLKQYQKENITLASRDNTSSSFHVYIKGQGAKVVIIIQELPGIGKETFALADRFVSRGYTVILPHLFGKLGAYAPTRNLLKVSCMKREFKLFAKNESSPIVNYLSALCSLMKERYKVNGVAVIGMCLTGNFAISLMANEDVLAGFASQPSLPLFAPNAIHMSTEEIQEVKSALDKKGPMHCGRFKYDVLCSGQKIESLKRIFNEEGRERIIFHELPGYRHAILTHDFVDKEGHPTHQALEDVFSYFEEALAK